LKKLRYPGFRLGLQKGSQEHKLVPVIPSQLRPRCFGGREVPYQNVNNQSINQSIPSQLKMAQPAFDYGEDRR